MGEDHEPTATTDRRDPVTRRAVLAGSAASLVAVMTGAAGRAELAGHLRQLQPIEAIPNPLAAYPNRDWEDVYRDLYTPDSTYHYLCAPNDTHGCLLKASVKNGIAVYADPSFGYHKATDLYGNQASNRWDPRACVSGLAYVRRAYSDRRVKGCYVRKGFKDWVDAGMPRGDDGQPPLKYRSGRGKENFVKMSHEDAAALAARVYIDVATTYSGDEGAKRLEDQGYYEPEMIEAMHHAGTQVLKFRGGMPFNAPFRVGGFYRLTNMMALLDVAVRDVDPSESYGGRHWDSFAWHTDLPPGHPMVTGQQSLDFDLNTAENANLITLWGMNWIATKMPDGHWLTEARLHGAKVVTIAPEYQSSTCKADRAITIRAGADAALAFGMAHVVVRDNLYDAQFVKTQTDLSLLVRTDNMKLLKASDIIAGYANADLRTVKLTEPGEVLPPPAEQPLQYVPRDLREAWGDQVVWDTARNGPSVVTHDHTGTNFPAGVDPALEGTFEVTLVDGSTLKVRPVFDAVKQYLMDTCSPEKMSKVSWVPVEAIEELAKDIAANPAKTLFVSGMGPNHFYNNDNSGRAIILLASLTNNVGHFGGSVGSYSGNYRLPSFSGINQWTYEDPFDITLDPPSAVRKAGAVCPPFYFGGLSEAARQCAAEGADVYLMWPEPVAAAAELVEDMTRRAAAFGRTLKFGFRVHMIVRETEAEARAAAERLVSKLDDDEGRKIRERSLDAASAGVARQAALREGSDDGYVEDNLWTGIGRARSGCGAAIVGDPDQVLAKIEAYRAVGIDAFIFSGYPHRDEAELFGKYVLPKLDHARFHSHPVPRV